MSDSDKDRIDGAGDKISGNVKEGVGKLTGDKQTESEGKGEQAKGDIKQGMADVKDKVGDMVDKVKGDH
ncbi:MAG: CsbD family protein [Thermomicrobiales bacterium]